MIRLAWLAMLLGLALRLVSCAAHDQPRGDVVLDVGVARSLVAGEGFGAGYERGVVRVEGDAPIPVQGLADQHPPLWPLIGAALTPLAGSPFAALQLASLLAGLAVVLLTMRMADRLSEGVDRVPDGVGPLAGALTAGTFVAIDSAGNGSLYALQAALVLGLVELLARRRPGWLAPGLILGALCALNHQALVLLPLPLVVRVAGACPGKRLRPLLGGLATIGVACLCQVPWGLRNIEHFGDPMFSVNGMYLKYWAGLELSFAVEGGQPVMRLMGELGTLDILRAMLGFAPMNGLYLFGTGLLVWPGLLGLALVATPGLAWTAWERRDRRLLGLLAATALLLAVAWLWPATKLRYLVTLQPLVTLLGITAAVRTRARWEGALTVLLCVGWVGLLVATLDDATGTAADARPLRFVWLAAGGAGALVLPVLARRGFGRAGGGLDGGLLVLVSGLPVVLVAALAVALGPLAERGSGTAYHGTWFWPDVFGKHHEAQAAALDGPWQRAAEAATEAGVTQLAGPIEMLAFASPELVELPALAPDVFVPSLQALLDAGRVDGLVYVGEPDGELVVPFPHRFDELVTIEAEDGSRVLVLRRRGL